MKYIKLLDRMELVLSNSKRGSTAKDTLVR